MRVQVRPDTGGGPGNAAEGGRLHARSPGGPQGAAFRHHRRHRRPQRHSSRCARSLCEGGWRMHAHAASHMPCACLLHSPAPAALARAHVGFKQNSPMPACCAALHRHRMQERVPFDQSLHAGLDELELVAYATVSDALRAARVEPSEVDILTTLLGATDACSQHDLTPCVT